MEETDEVLRVSFKMEDGIKYPFKEILRLTLALDGYYKSLGGYELILVNDQTGIELEVSESPYELHLGTPFANTRMEFREDKSPSYVLREDAYSAIEELAKPEDRENIRKSLDLKFSKDFMKDKLPRKAVFAYLFEKLKGNSTLF